MHQQRHGSQTHVYTAADNSSNECACHFCRKVRPDPHDGRQETHATHQQTSTCIGPWISAPLLLHCVAGGLAEHCQSFIDIPTAEHHELSTNLQVTSSSWKRSRAPGGRFGWPRQGWQRASRGPTLRARVALWSACASTMLFNKLRGNRGSRTVQERDDGLRRQERRV